MPWKCIMVLPVQFTSAGSGTHNPFIHIEILGPLSIGPKGQSNVTVLPSNSGSTKSRTLMELVT